MVTVRLWRIVSQEYAGPEVVYKHTWQIDCNGDCPHAALAPRLALPNWRNSLSLTLSDSNRMILQAMAIGVVDNDADNSVSSP